MTNATATKTTKAVKTVENKMEADTAIAPQATATPDVAPTVDKASAVYLGSLWARAKAGDRAEFTSPAYYQNVAKVNNVILREVTDYSGYKPVRTEIVLVKPIKATSRKAKTPKILGKMTPMGIEVCPDVVVDTVELAAINKANSTWALELKEKTKRQALEATTATNAEHFENDESGVYVEL